MFHVKHAVMFYAIQPWTAKLMVLYTKNAELANISYILYQRYETGHAGSSSAKGNLICCSITIPSLTQKQFKRIRSSCTSHRFPVCFHRRASVSE